MASSVTNFTTLHDGNLTSISACSSGNGSRDTEAPSGNTTLSPVAGGGRTPPSISSQWGSIVSSEVFNYSSLIVNTWICISLGILGVVTNIITCVVFHQQGFKDSVNISMTAIALWDLVKSVSSIFHRIGGVIGLVSRPQGLSWTNSTTPTLGFLPIFAGYVSCALASYVSVERCLCVSIPLKVKLFFTPKFTLVMVTLISVVVFGAFFIMFFIYDTISKYFPKYNAYIIVLQSNEFHQANEHIIMTYHKTMSILIPCLSFAILCTCSVITVYYLRKSSKSIHGKSTMKTGDDSYFLTPREKQVAKMLFVIVLVYIINLVPRIGMFFASLAEPEFYMLKKYNYLFAVVLHQLFVLDYINSSINLFIFLKMSSNFRAKFSAICSKKNRSIRSEKTVVNAASSD